MSSFFLLIPITLIFFLSKILQKKLKISFFKAIFLSNSVTAVYYYFFLKTDIFYLGNTIFIFSVTLLFFFEKINKKKIKEFNILIIISLLIIIFSKDFYFYKYDEFSEYGIITKLIFYLDTLPINEPIILNKGSYNKINLLSCFYIFFLKNSSFHYQENTIIFSNIFYIVTLILCIIGEFKNLNLFKKTFAFFIIIAFTYMLNAGLDRIYPETILSLLCAYTLVLLDKINSEFSKRDFNIILLCLFIIFSIKQSGMVISILFGIFIISNLFIIKKYKSILKIVCVYFFYFGILYFHNFKISHNFFNETTIYKNESFYDTISAIPKAYVKSEINYSNLANSIIISNQKESIYHLYSFSWLNSILSNFKISFVFPSIKLNFYFWIFFFLALFKIDNTTFLSKKYYYHLLILLLAVLYQFIITIWAYNNNLVFSDGSLIVSWSRHLGVFINAFLIFYFLHMYNSNQNYKKIIYIVTILIFIFAPLRTFRGIIPLKIENKIAFWENRFEQRKQIKELSKFIALKNPKKKPLFIIDKNKLDPYFPAILNYELIDINLNYISEKEILLLKTIDNDGYFILSYQNSLEIPNVKIKESAKIGPFILTLIK